jgi:hypothetical protein
VTADVEDLGSTRCDTSPWRSVAIFLALTICLDAPFWLLINATHTVDAAYIFGMMSMPRGGCDPHLPHRGPSVALTGVGRLERPRSFVRSRLPHPVDVLRTDRSAGFQPWFWVGAVIPRGFLLVPTSKIPAARKLRVVSTG